MVKPITKRIAVVSLMISALMFAGCVPKNQDSDSNTDDVNVSNDQIDMNINADTTTPTDVLGLSLGAGTQATVSNITLNKPGFVAVWSMDQSNKPDKVIGNSTLLPQGSSNEVKITTQTLQEGKSYTVALYYDDGDGIFDATKDTMVQDNDGKGVMTTFVATKDQSAAMSNTNVNVNANMNANVNTNQSTGPVKQFTMTAKDWQFTPSTITVNKGDKVKLTVTALDKNHGFALPDFNVNVNLPKGEAQVIEFTADKQGTFTFFCSVFCGSGHGNMKGSLIVK